jgi:opacity protein-like surface antigen
MRTRIALLAAPLLLCAAWPASASDRFRLVLNGAFDTNTPAFSETRTFTEFAEEGQFQATYSADSAFGFDVGAQYNFTQRFGIYASFGQSSRDASAVFDAALPHPLFFNQDRDAVGTLTALDYKERQIHVDFVLSGGRRSVRTYLFGGVTLFKVEAGLIDHIAYSQEYPYDSVTLQPTPVRLVEDSPVGFNAGVGFDYKVGQSIALGVQGRFSRATAKLEPVAGQTIEIDAGGFQVAGGLRFVF